jgi:hypothetical protein
MGFLEADDGVMKVKSHAAEEGEFGVESAADVPGKEVEVGVSLEVS